MTLERALFVCALASGVVLTCVSGVAWGGREAISTACGALIAVLNLWILRRIVRDLVSTVVENRAGSSFLLGPKLLGLVGLAWLLFARKIASPMTFIFGYAALPIGVAIAAVVCEKPR